MHRYLPTPSANKLQCTSNEEPIYAHSAKGADVMTLDQPIEGTPQFG